VSEFGGEINAGSDAWNVADGYTKLKILRQLIMLELFTAEAGILILRTIVQKAVWLLRWLNAA